MLSKIAWCNENLEDLKQQTTAYLLSDTVAHIADRAGCAVFITIYRQRKRARGKREIGCRPAL